MTKNRKIFLSTIECLNRLTFQQSSCVCEVREGDEEAGRETIRGRTNQ